MPPNGDELRALRRQQIDDALANPAERDRILVEAVLEVKDALPPLEVRVSRLERFRTWLLGVGAALAITGIALWELLQRRAP